MILSDEVIRVAADAFFSNGYSTRSTDQSMRVALLAILPDIEKAVREECAQCADAWAAVHLLEKEKSPSERMAECIAVAIRSLPSPNVSQDALDWAAGEMEQIAQGEIKTRPFEEFRKEVEAARAPGDIEEPGCP